MNERRLPGGNTGGACLVGGTVRRATGPWTASVHALLDHLQARDFEGAPRALGIDEQGREVLSFLDGSTVGDLRPWPAWVRSDEALVEIGRWLRSYHDTVADFVPSADARWRGSTRAWRPGDVIGHNDAAPYNAVWQPSPKGPMSDSRGQLVGFIDWDFAAPCAAIWDLAFTVFSWVPLHARDIAAGDGFTRFADRPRRLRLLLDAYGYAGTVKDVLDVVSARVQDHAHGVRELAAAGDPFCVALVEDGVVGSLDRALRQLDHDRGSLEREFDLND